MAPKRRAEWPCSDDSGELGLHEDKGAGGQPLYDWLQRAMAEVGGELRVPEIVVIGRRSRGKSSLLEALLGFRFNGEMATRRPLVLRMIRDCTAVEPRCRFQEENSEDYGSPVVGAAAIADLIKGRTESHLREIQAAVSSKPIVIRFECSRRSNCTIIDTQAWYLNLEFRL